MIEIAVKGRTRERNNQPNEATTPSLNSNCLQNPPKKGRRTKKANKKIKLGLVPINTTKIIGKNDKK